MRIVPLTIKQAEEFLAKHDRHYKAPVEAICALGVEEEGVPSRLDVSGGISAELRPLPTLHGAAILGRLDAQQAELAHIYVDGVSQGYSLLYGACWRALKALGYKKAVL